MVSIPAAGNPGRGWWTWIAHHQPAVIGLIGAFFLLDLLVSSWFTIAIVATGALLGAVGVWHLRVRICERCADDVPLDGAAAAEKNRMSLWLVHRISTPLDGFLQHIANHPILIAVASVAVVFALDWIGALSIIVAGIRVVWLPLFVATILFLMYGMRAGQRHDSLQPWCPWCRSGGGGDDETVPEPRPTTGATLRPRR